MRCMVVAVELSVRTARAILGGSRAAVLCAAAGAFVLSLVAADPAEARRHRGKSHHARTHHAKSHHATSHRARTHRAPTRNAKVYSGHGSAIVGFSMGGGIGRAPFVAMDTAAAAYGEARSERRAGRSSRRGQGVRMASLGGGEGMYEASRGSVAGGGAVRWAASSSCLNGTLSGIVSDVSSMASVTVNSTCRSHGHNRAVGGARHSQHLTGDAVDFRVHGNVAQVAAYLRSNPSVGGFKHYGGGLFHIDTGPRRTW